MLAIGPQPTIRYFHLARLMMSSYQKAEKKIVKWKNKRIEREADSRYVEGVINVEWERNGEREKKKGCLGKKKRKKKLGIFINIYYIWTIKNLGASSYCLNGLKAGPALNTLCWNSHEEWLFLAHCQLFFIHREWWCHSGLDEIQIWHG